MGLMEGFAVVVYDRTSGDEDSTGQDVRAAAARTVNDALARAYRVVAEPFMDEDVKGDTDPFTRPGFKAATQFVLEGKAEGIVVREWSRVWRGKPAEGVMLADRLVAMGLRGESLKEQHFRFVSDPDPEEGPPDERVLLRFVTCWSNWTELRRIRSRTKAAMSDFKEGRRETESGKPAHRPAKELGDADLAVARRVLAEPDGNMSKAARAVSEFRGAFATSDPKKRRDRLVSRDTLARALGVRADRAQKEDVRQSPDGPHENGGARNGSLLRTAPGGSS